MEMSMGVGKEGRWAKGTQERKKTKQTQFLYIFEEESASTVQCKRITTTVILSVEPLSTAAFTR